MVFATLVEKAGVARPELCRELQIEPLLLEQWLSGSVPAPDYVVRAVRLVAELATNGKEEGAQSFHHLPRPIRGNAFKLVSLFSGAGGLDIGLEKAGFRTLLANEVESHACQSLRANKMLSTIKRVDFNRWFDTQVAGQRCYRNATKDEMTALRARISPAAAVDEGPLASATVIESDVRTLSTEAIMHATGTTSGEIDLVAGGAPCQPFSRAGKQETVDCADGRLFLKFVRLVDGLRPRWFLFENVKGLVQHRTEALYATCPCCSATHPVSFALRSVTVGLDQLSDTCASCGRSGVVTARWEKRRGGSLDMVEAEFSRLGYSCQAKVLNARNFGAPQDRDRLFIIGSRDGERFEWPDSTHGPSPSSRSLFDTRSSLPYVSVRDALYRDGHEHYGHLGEQAVVWVKNVVRPHDEPVTWSLDRFAPTVGAHQAAKLAIAPFGVPAAQLARQQWHTLGRRQGDTDPVFVEHKYLTDRELLILQTFPARWYLHGTRMERAFQIGNAVPPVLASAVGASLVNAMTGQNAVSSSRALAL